MTTRLALIISAAMLCLLTFGCDDFSLRQEYAMQHTDYEPSDSDDPSDSVLDLNPSTTNVLQGSSLELQPEGGQPPYQFSAYADDLAYLDPDTKSGSFTDNRFNAGRSIGRIHLSAQDSQGIVGDVVITIRPAAPYNPTITPVGGSKNLRLEWQHSFPGIEVFRIERIDQDGTTVNQDPVDGDNESGEHERSYTLVDNGATSNNEYTYRIYAETGSYRSQSVEVEFTP